MFVPKDEVYRHLILQILFNSEMSYSGKSDHFDCDETAVNAADIEKKLNLPLQKIKELVGTLIISQDVKRCEMTNDKFLYSMAEKGYASYLENFCIKRGRSYILSSIKDNLYIAVSLIAIISAISSLTLYITSTRNTQKEVIQLRKEVQEIKTQLYPKVPKRN